MGSPDSCQRKIAGTTGPRRASGIQPSSPMSATLSGGMPGRPRQTVIKNEGVSSCSAK